jgi:ubiquinone/menaquinone biosynthesis C-methylase UbiE
VADSNGRYDAQARGDRGAYERYLRGMNASMQQKVALTAAHLLGRGRIADMGMGSGAGSHALAALYPALDVVGVDINPQMVEIAAETYREPNLQFIVGDIAAAVFEPGSLDAIFDSSVLHHVTSFNGYGDDQASAALRVQTQQLREGGVLIVRDFLAPAGPTRVWLDVADDDGDATDDPSRCSTAALLRRFAREFRSLHPQPGFDLAEVEVTTEAPALAAGRRRFALSHRHAVEFLLRKDYRPDWVSEVQEEYAYFDQARFESEYAALGLRVLASQPIRNPWIYEHRLEGRAQLWNADDGTAVALPATNYVIVGERVADDEGVSLSAEACAPAGYLQVQHHRDRKSGDILDLVRRPHRTIDAIPWFIVDDEVLVLARMSYPRPILAVRGADAVNLDDSRSPAWVTEPLTFVQDDKPLAQAVEDALADRVGIDPSAIQGFSTGPTYYPSPGGVQEEVRASFVRIDPVSSLPRLPATSGLSSSGRAGAIEARQLLRAAQVGGLPDARLELSVHALLRQLRRSAGPWIGAAIAVPSRETAVRITSVAELEARPRRRRFDRTEASAGFIERRAARFTERAADGRTLGTTELEYVVPASASLRTVAVAPLLRRGDMVLIGVEDDDRPAAQCIEGHSDLLVAPAWRLPPAATDLAAARAWIDARLRAEHGLEVTSLWPLGGHYHPSPGVTPEVVHPFAAAVTAPTPTRASTLRWVPLVELLDAPRLLHDGHLRIVAYRAAHALGLLDRPRGATPDHSG